MRPKILQGFNHTFDVKYPIENTNINGVLIFRGWQKEAFEVIQNTDKNHIIINAPMASGKSFLISAITMNKLISNPNLKAVISVPQKLIANGFIKLYIKYPNGFESKFEVPTAHNLALTTDKIKSNDERFTKFLESSAKDWQDRILLCCHKTLTFAWSNHKELFNNILFFIDEVHHAQNGYTEEGNDEGNELGKIIASSVREPERNNHIMAFTATLYRGDKTSIINPDIMNEFEIYKYAFDEFLKTCQHLEKFTYNFVQFKEEYLQGIRYIYKTKGIKKDIIYIPSMIHSCSTGDKHEEVDKIYKIIGGWKPNKPLNEFVTYGSIYDTIISKNGKELKVINMVEENQTIRMKRNEYINKAHQSDDPSLIDVVIALGTMKEGASWKWAEREIIVGTKNSITEFVQMSGRLFRDAKDKKQVDIYQILPMCDKKYEDMYRENLNEYIKAVLISMLLEDIIAPQKLKIPKKHTDNPKFKNIKVMNDIFETYEQQIEFTEMVKDAVVDMMSIEKYEDSKHVDIVRDVLSDMGIDTDYAEILSESILSKNKSRTNFMIDVNGLNVSGIDMELIKKMSYGWMLAIADVNTFKELRDAVDRSKLFLPFEEAREFVRSLNLKNEKPEFRNWIRKNKNLNIPSCPDNFYKFNGWISWGDWLGTGSIQPGKKTYLSMEEFKKIINQNNIKNKKQFDNFINSVNYISIYPKCPESVYKKTGEWKGFPYFFNTLNRLRENISYKEFKKIIKDNPDINTIKKYRKFAKKYAKKYNIPIVPENEYCDEFEGWNIIFNKHIEYVGYLEFVEIIKLYAPKNHKERSIWIRKNSSKYKIPKAPFEYYSKRLEWNGYYNNNIKRKKILHVDSGKIFPTLTDCASFFGDKSLASVIYTAIKLGRKTRKYGYFKYVED